MSADTDLADTVGRSLWGPTSRRGCVVGLRRVSVVERLRPRALLRSFPLRSGPALMRKSQVAPGKPPSNRPAQRRTAAPAVRIATTFSVARIVKSLYQATGHDSQHNPTPGGWLDSVACAASGSSAGHRGACSRICLGVTLVCISNPVSVQGSSASRRLPSPASAACTRFELSAHQLGKEGEPVLVDLVGPTRLPSHAPSATRKPWCLAPRPQRHLRPRNPTVAWSVLSWLLARETRMLLMVTPALLVGDAREDRGQPASGADDLHDNGPLRFWSVVNLGTCGPLRWHQAERSIAASGSVAVTPTKVPGSRSRPAGGPPSATRRTPSPRPRPQASTARSTGGSPQRS